ncbi:MAG: hypothetical protein NDJ94_00030 [Vicinamibacteria bacterium]|nr:hypothetical protein [Vicinamibacteria bacterium]
MIAALAAAALFYGLPLGAGATLLRLAGAHRRLPDAWLAGTLALTALLAAVNLSAPPLGLDAGTRHLLLQCGALALALPAVVEAVRRRAEIAARVDLPLAAAALGLAGVGTLIWRGDSPYPALLNWDMLEHLALSERMMRGDFHLSLRAYSDTFTLDTYLPFYHVLLSLPRLLLAPPPAGYAWSLDTVHHLVGIATAGWAARHLFGSRGASAWAMVIAAFTFESHVAYTALFHMPQTLTAVFFTAALGSLAAAGPAGLPTLVLLRWAAFIALSHYFVGALAAPLLLALGLAARAEPAVARRAALLVAALAAAGLAAALLVRHVAGISLDPFRSAESAHFTLPLQASWHLICRSYGYAPLLLLPLGAATLRRGSALSLAVLGATAASLAAVLSPFPYVLKFATLFHFLGALVMAAGLRRLVAGAGWPGAAAWLAAWITIFTINQAAAFKRELHDGIHSLVSADEREAAEVLRVQVADPSRTLLVGDPATQHILEGLSGVETQGGTFASARTRRLVDEMWPVAEPADAARSALAIRDKLATTATERVVVALGGRFFAWQAAPPELKRATHFNVWRPRDLNAAGRLEVERWCASGRFRRLFQNEGVALLEIVVQPTERAGATISH